MAAQGDEVARGVPDLAVLLHEAVLDEVAVERQHIGPGAGMPRTCTVSSTVGTQPAGMSTLKTAGGKASATSNKASVSMGRPSANANQPCIVGLPDRSPTKKPASSV